MKELNLLLQLPQDVSTRYRSVDMTVLAAFAISFCQRNCVFLCKGTKLQKAVLFAIVRRSFMEESCFCFWKAKETVLLKKQAKICFFKTRQTLRERGNQRFRCDGFPSPLDPHPFLSPTRGHPWTPKSFLCNSLVQKLQNSACAEFWDGLPVSLLECFIAFGSRRAVSGFGLGFLVSRGFLGAKAPPGPPYAVPSLFEIGILITEFSVSWIRWLWLTAFDKSGLFRCQSIPGPPEPCYFITRHVIPTEPSGEWRNLGLVFS